jgi:dolichyl-phosphate beta-glucosyltransferase
MSEPSLWISIPCYNEGSRFQVQEFSNYLSTHPNVGFVLVNDGSTDNTKKLLAVVAAQHPKQTEIIDLPRNVGKAEAVRQGMLLCFTKSAAVVGFWDADLATPLYEIEEMLHVFRFLHKIEIVMGARVKLLGRRIDRHLARHYVGRVFATMASTVLNLGSYDTQCGAKLFKVSEQTQAIFETKFITNWTFDVELLARYLGPFRDRSRPQRIEMIYEYPLKEWFDVTGSHVRPIDFFRAIMELTKIMLNYCFTGKLKLRR